MDEKSESLNPGRIQRLYTIYDRVAEEAAPITAAQNDAVAVRKFRQFQGQVDPTCVQDFRLVFLGEFNLRDMTMKCPVNPVEIPVPFMPFKELKDA